MGNSCVRLIEGSFFCQADQCMDFVAIPLTLFTALPYHPPHATRSGYLHDPYDGGRLGRLSE